MQRDSAQPHMTQKERERREIQRQIASFLQRGGEIAVIERAGAQKFPGTAHAWQRDQDESLNLFYF